MADIDSLVGAKRRTPRDSLLLSTMLAVEGLRKPVQVRVRDLSSKGMRVESPTPFTVGARVAFMLRTVGPIEGAIVWVKPGSAGVAFDAEIDMGAVRHPVAKSTTVAWRPPQIYSNRPGLKPRS